jgi:hypothetical protein
LAVIDIRTLVALGMLIGLVLFFRIPVTRGHVVRLAKRVGGWALTYCQRTEEHDPDQDALWLMERRRKLCADLRRVEHLLATDTWMSATRQRGNRIAYNRLVDDLRHTPDVVPAIFQPHTFDPWDESSIEPRSRWLSGDGWSRQQPTVEVLEIGWSRRRAHARSR